MELPSVKRRRTISCLSRFSMFDIAAYLLGWGKLL